VKYIANPIEVEAHRIVSVGPGTATNEAPGPRNLALENGENVTATSEMCARMAPKVGDYWVIQSDGYIYLNPKEVFERKYSPERTFRFVAIKEAIDAIRALPLPNPSALELERLKARREAYADAHKESGCPCNTCGDKQVRCYVGACLFDLDAQIEAAKHTTGGDAF
jgi:hypothetical protein